MKSARQGVKDAHFDTGGLTLDERAGQVVLASNEWTRRVSDGDCFSPANPGAPRPIVSSPRGSSRNNPVLTLYRMSKHSRIQSVGTLLRKKDHVRKVSLASEDDLEHLENLRNALDRADSETNKTKDHHRHHRVKFNLGKDAEEMEELIPVQQLEFNHDDFKMTQGDFRRLSEQLRQVNISKAKDFRGSGFHRFYSNENGENVPLVYRSQLASSFKAFKDKRWVPYEHDPKDVPYLRCRPVSCTSDRFEQRRASRCNTPVRPRRIKSAPTYSQSIQHNRVDAYDRLTPSVMYELSDGATPQPFYGEKMQVLGVGGPIDKSKLKKRKNADEDGDGESSTDANNSDNNSDSGVGVDTESGININFKSENEGGEVKTEQEMPEEFKKKASKADINLRPEQLDALYIPEGKKDKRRFDFDAADVEIPPYEFEYLFSNGFEKMDWRDLVETLMSREEDTGKTINWRDMIKRRPRLPEEYPVIDRLMELQRYEIETEDWEEEKREKVKETNSQLTRQKNSMNNLSRGLPARVKSAGARRDRRCDKNCVQPACVGDCPEKRVPPDTCVRCRQKWCDGRCASSVYDSHSRKYQDSADYESNNMSGNGSRHSITERPKSCNSCKRPSTAKLINANNIILGRPKSGNATFSRGQGSAKPRDLRSATPSTGSLSSELSKLGLSPSRPGTAKAKSRPRGRNAISPGKSYFSQRKNSITEHYMSERLRAIRKQWNTNVTPNATKLQRPKTAAV